MRDGHISEVYLRCGSIPSPPVMAFCPCAEIHGNDRTDGWRIYRGRRVLAPQAAEVC